MTNQKHYIDAIKRADNTVYLDAEQVKDILKCKRSKAYDTVKILNALRNKQGKLVINGKIPAKDFYIYLYCLNSGLIPKVYPDTKADLKEIEETIKQCQTTLIEESKTKPISPVELMEKAVDIAFNVRSILASDNSIIREFPGNRKLAMLSNRLTKNALGIYGNAITVRLESRPAGNNDMTLSRIGGALIEIKTLLKRLKEKLKSTGIDPAIDNHFKVAIEESDNILAGISGYNTLV